MLRKADSRMSGNLPGRTASSGLLVFGGTFVGNILAYGFNVVLSRSLGPTGYAELGTLLVIFLVGSVAGLAVQAVNARRVAIAVDGPPGERSELCRRLRSRGLLTGAAVAVAFAAAAPAVSALLPSVSALGVAWTGVAIAASTVFSGYLGLAQGASRFGTVAALYLAANTVRLAIGVAAGSAGASPSTVMAASSGAWVVSAAAGHFLLRDLTRERDGARGATSAERAASIRGYGGELLRACVGLGGILLFANLDPLFAGRYLTDANLGRYNAAALLSRAAFFGPAFIAILVYPRLARPAERRRALFAALAATSVIGVAAVAVSAAIGGPLVKAAFGAKYADSAGAGFDIGGHAWLFTAVGALLAVVQLALLDGVARRSHAVSAVVLAGIAGEVVAITGFAHGGPVAIVTAAASCAALTAVVSVALCLLVQPSEVAQKAVSTVGGGERQVGPLPQTSS